MNGTLQWILSGAISPVSQTILQMTLFSKQCVLKICQGCSSFSSKQRNKDLGSGVSDCRHVLIYCGEDYRTCPYQRVGFDQFLKQSLFADAVYSGCAVTTSEKACIKSNCVDTSRPRSSFRQQISYTCFDFCLSDRK